MYNINNEKMLSRQIIDTLRNFIKRNSGDIATVEMLVNVGCEIFDISQDAMISVLNCKEELE